MQRIIRDLVALVVVACCAACGGGGGGGSSSGSGYTLTGGVSANNIYPGTVKIFGVNADGTLKLPALAVVATGADGSYSASIGSYQGGLAGVAFGSYLDETSNTVINIPESKGLYAALPAVDTAGKTVITFPINVLTDLAYRKAREAADFNSSLRQANQMIGQLFGIDLTNTVPVPFNTASLATATSAQVRLATILRTLSQLVATGSLDPAAPTADDLQNCLAVIAAGTKVSSGQAQLSPTVSYLMQQASANVSASPKAQLVIAAGGAASQSAIVTLSSIGSPSGKKLVKVSFRTTGGYSGKIGGITITVGLPVGFTMNPDVNGVPVNGMITATGVASTDSYLSGQQVGATLKANIANSYGFSLGEFMTIYGEIDIASSSPSASAFVPVALVKIVDLDGATISGVNLETM